MTFEQFTNGDGTTLNGALLALWFDAHGDWERAHEVAQEMDGADGAWVHAYLHRKEGDVTNAAYWYRRAGRRVAIGDLAQEREAMVRDFLATQAGC